MDTLVNTIKDEDSEKFGDTVGKAMGKGLVKTLVAAIDLRSRPVARH